ncbi:MAG: channel protein TolC [Burkholderiales bacterium PBB4]|nr:MAG: channel protein TolC [Burkholderiales bacterium PBB4]
MLRLSRLCAALTLVLPLSQAWALDLTQAYQAALEQDASIKASRAYADAGRESVPQARAQLLPYVSASFSRNNNQLESTTPNILGQLSSSSYSYPSSNDTVTVRQPIYRSAQWAQYRQAQAQVVDVEAVLENDLQNLAVKVGSAYFEALLAQDQLALNRSQLAGFKAHLESARKLLAAGSGTRTEVDEAQARLDMGVAQELESLQNVDYTRQQLQVMVNQPLDALATLNADRLNLSPPAPASVEAWIRRAEESSAELRALRARVEAARQEVVKSRSGHYPTLDAVAQWSRSSSENSVSINSTYETRSLGVQLTVPIYSGGGVNSSVRQALANRERAEQILEAARRDLGVRVHKEYRGGAEGVLRVRALEQAVRSALLAQDSSRKSFEGGARTRIDVLNAETAVVVATRDLAQARYVYLISQLRLQALVSDAGLASIELANQALKP